MGYLTVLLLVVVASLTVGLPEESFDHDEEESPQAIIPDITMILLQGHVSGVFRDALTRTDFTLRGEASHPVASSPEKVNGTKAQQASVDEKGQAPKNQSAALITQAKAVRAEHEVTALGESRGEPVWEPLLDVDFVMDADNYLEDYDNASEIVKEFAANNGVSKTNVTHQIEVADGVIPP
mmetsp:Transcript_70506/g.222729  ORF Transcript_70506/g.222729 Transcript_70506/m.222729 type:complete len:181 (-) Transcript_70506:263-805(-)